MMAPAEDSWPALAGHTTSTPVQPRAPAQAQNPLHPAHPGNPIHTSQISQTSQNTHPHHPHQKQNRRKHISHPPQPGTVPQDRPGYPPHHPPPAHHHAIPQHVHEAQRGHHSRNVSTQDSLVLSGGEGEGFSVQTATRGRRMSYGPGAYEYGTGAHAPPAPDIVSRMNQLQVNQSTRQASDRTGAPVKTAEDDGGWKSSGDFPPGSNLNPTQPYSQPNTPTPPHGQFFHPLTKNKELTSSTRASPASITRRTLAETTNASFPLSTAASPPSQPHHTLSKQHRPVDPAGSHSPAPPPVPTNVGQPGEMHYASRHVFYPSQHDPNRLAVDHPRQWGHPPAGRFDDATESPLPFSPAVLGNPVSSASDEGWDPNGQLRKWASGVPPVPPPETPTVPPTPVHDTPPSSISRADSAAPVQVAQPTTVYYSDTDKSDKSEADEDLPTPNATIFPPSVAPTAATVTRQPRAPRAPTVVSVSVEGEELPEEASEEEAPPGRNIRSPGQSVRAGGAGRGRRGGPPSVTGAHTSGRPPIETTYVRRGPRGPGGEGQWWKKDPHPAYSHTFATRRLVIRFPYALRFDHVRQFMFDHFSRYGTIRCVWPDKTNGESCEKAFVVFKEEEDLRKCTEDPKRTEATFRSGGTLAGTPMILDIRPGTSESARKTIFVKIVGRRFDERSRSASPPLRKNDHGGDTGNGHDHQRRRRDRDDRIAMPKKVFVDWVPRWNKQQDKIYSWARVRAPRVSFENLHRRTVAETGRPPLQIAEIDLGRRVPESDIVPRLVDFFGEIADILPPTSPSQGWLVSMSGGGEARAVMDELGKIPGIVARWAQDGDGYMPDEIQTQPEEDELKSPLTRLEKHLDCTIARDGVILPSVHEQSESSTASIGQSGKSEAGGSVTPDGTSPPQPIQVTDPSATPIGDSSDPHYPGLIKRVIPTYKGRSLREETSTGETKYYDECAVFVGRLVKGQETELTLWRRFARYGDICQIEYKPLSAQSTYSTARILYRDKLAATRAIEFEHGAVSFGSALKVEERRVLPGDVTLKEMLIDVHGRAVSPSIASQYSPPSANSGSDYNFVPPPPQLMSPPALVPPYTPNMGVPIPMAPVLPMQVASAWPGGWSPYPAAAIPRPPQTPGHMAGIPQNHGLVQSPLAPVGVPLQPTPYPPMGQPMAMPPATNQPVGALHPSFIPVLYSMGIAYYPSPSQYGVSSTPFATAPIANPSPPPSPPNIAPAPSVSQGCDALPSLPLSEKIQAAQVPHPGVVPAQEISSPSRPSYPRPVGFKEEGGMLKAIYDKDELKLYRLEHGIPEPPPTPPRAEKLKLLPIHTGGHDLPASAAPSAGRERSSPGSAGTERRHSLADTSVLFARPPLGPPSGSHSKTVEEAIPVGASEQDGNESAVKEAKTEQRFVPIPIPFSPTQPSHSWASMPPTPATHTSSLPTGGPPDLTRIGGMVSAGPLPALPSEGYAHAQRRQGQRKDDAPPGWRRTGKGRGQRGYGEQDMGPVHADFRNKDLQNRPREAGRENGREGGWGQREGESGHVSRVVEKTGVGSNEAVDKGGW